jgi:acyl-CoA synthetase (NDP forming)
MPVAAALQNEHAIEELLTKARERGRRTLSETESKALLQMAGIRIPREKVVQNGAEAAAAAREMGFPIVLKIVSPDIAHKTEVGGVKLGLASAEEVQHACDEMLTRIQSNQPGAHIEGVLVAEMLKGLEVILGTTTDSTFGPVVMFGVGGVFVESFKDVAFRLIPLDREDAAAMLSEIKGAPLLDGFRGSAAVNKDSIVDALMQLSELALRFRGYIEEIDVNPVLATPQGAVAVDALVKIKSASAS